MPFPLPHTANQGLAMPAITAAASTISLTHSEGCRLEKRPRRNNTVGLNAGISLPGKPVSIFRVEYLTLTWATKTHRCIQVPLSLLAIHWPDASQAGTGPGSPVPSSTEHSTQAYTMHTIDGMNREEGQEREAKGKQERGKASIEGVKAGRRQNS